MVLYMGADGPLYAFSLFLPSIINQLGEWGGICGCASEAN